VRPPRFARFDIVAALGPRDLSPEEAFALSRAPLAQTPRNGKRFVRVTPTAVYKGPFSRTDDRHVRALQQAFFRTAVTASWRDPIVLPQELVVDPSDGSLYMRSEFIGSRADPKAWSVTRVTLRTHKRIAADVLSMESAGVVKLSQAMRSAWFERAAPKALVHMACRYLLGAGDAHFANIICREDGAMLSAVDLEENRESVPTLATQDQPPTLFDCLFTRLRQPAQAERDILRGCMRASLPALEALVSRVRRRDAAAEDDLARLIGYDRALDGPSDEELSARLDTLQACIDAEREALLARTAEREAEERRAPLARRAIFGLRVPSADDDNESEGEEENEEGIDPRRSHQQQQQQHLLAVFGAPDATAPAAAPLPPPIPQSNAETKEAPRDIDPMVTTEQETAEPLPIGLQAGVAPKAEGGTEGAK